MVPLSNENTETELKIEDISKNEKDKSDHHLINDIYIPCDIIGNLFLPSSPPPITTTKKSDIIPY